MTDQDARVPSLAPGPAGPGAWLRGLFAVLVCGLLLGLPAPTRGLWGRRYLANLPMPTRAAWNGIGQPFTPVDSAEPEGIGAYLSTECPEPENARALVELERLSLGWARTEIPWAGVEPERGRYDWERWDRVVDGLRAHHYHVLGMLCYWTGWVEPYSDAAIEAFGRYSEAVARRYRGRVDHWEVWNEPNERGFWNAGPARYVALLKAAYQGVRRGNPDATVIGGSLSGADLVYFRELVRLGAARWMDALSLHPYCFGWAPEDTDILAELRGMSREMARLGKDPGLWVTEIGFPRGDRVQAEWLARTLVLLRQSRVVRHSFWFTLYLPGGTSYSLYRGDWTPRPAARRLETLTRDLRGSTPRGSAAPHDLIPPYAAGSPYAYSPLQAWDFEDGRGVRRAVWVPGGRVEVSDPAQRGPHSLTTAPQWWAGPRDE